MIYVDVSRQIYSRSRMISLKLVLPGGTRLICMICHKFFGLDLYHAYPAQPLTTAGDELDDLQH